jgi:hypothetical protein
MDTLRRTFANAIKGANPQERQEMAESLIDYGSQVDKSTRKAKEWDPDAHQLSMLPSKVNLDLEDDFDETSALKKLNPRICELKCESAVNDKFDLPTNRKLFSDAKKMCECCHAAFYCSRDCQRTHWATHKRYCGAHGIARKYRGEATWIAAVFWVDRTPDGHVWFPLCVRCDDSVDDVKRKIRDRFGVALAAQALTTSRGATIRSFHDISGLAPTDFELMETGTLADFELVRGRLIALSTEPEHCAVPRPTCERCRQCIGGACRLEFGPRAADAHNYPEIHQDVPAVVGRNDPCPCGSGRKYKKCCGR